MLKSAIARVVKAAAQSLRRVCSSLPGSTHLAAAISPRRPLVMRP